MQPLSAHSVTRWWAARVAALGPAATDLSDPATAAATVRAALDAGLLELAPPGAGATAGRWTALAALAAADVTLAKLAEAHADAVAVLAELGAPPPGPGQLWAVWAAVTPLLIARPGAEGRWVLDGRKPWASGSGCCDHALVTAAAPDGERLFAVDLGAAHSGSADQGAADLGAGTVTPDAASWPAVAMSGTGSVTLGFRGVSAVPVGAPGAYVDRPGFLLGGAGIAACWYGGAVGIAFPLLARVGGPAVDPHRDAHLGAVHAALTATRCALEDVARTVDGHLPADLTALTSTVRVLAERTATEVVDRVGRALGPGPLATDRAHARRVADLTLFVRQSHAERDLAALGRHLAAPGSPPVAW